MTWNQINFNTVLTRTDRPKQIDVAARGDNVDCWSSTWKRCGNDVGW